ncbi:MAG: hypothetical protein ABW360_10535 [Phenylobacterium sp.]
MTRTAIALALALAAASGLAACKPRAPIPSDLPRGMVAFFQLNGCPRGWADAPATWQGRYVVATIGGEAPGQVVGDALASRENRPAGAHTHTTGVAFTGGNCSDGKCARWGGNGAIQRNPLRTDGGDGLKAGTNAPYVALRACVRN